MPGALPALDLIDHRQYTVTELARLIGRGREYAVSLLDSGAIPCRRAGGRGWRFAMGADIRAWLVRERARLEPQGQLAPKPMTLEEAKAAGRRRAQELSDHFSTIYAGE
jgi:hypothetical protein